MAAGVAGVKRELAGASFSMTGLNVSATGASISNDDISSFLCNVFNVS